MATLTIAVDMIARAIAPGARNCTGSSPPIGSPSTIEKNTRTSTGMTSVSSTDSPRRSVSTTSVLAWARTARTAGAALTVPPARR